MKQLYPLLTFLFVLLSVGLSAQAGMVVELRYKQSNGDDYYSKLSYKSDINGRHAYANAFARVTWEGDYWEINDDDVGIVARSTMNSNPNPPDFATGNWVEVEPLVTLYEVYGTGTVAYVAPLEVKLTTNASITCNGAADGGLTATATGGTADYTYTWSTGAETTTAGATSLSDLTADTYSVTVTDQSGAEATTSITLGQPAALVLTGKVDKPVSCHGDADGAVSVSVTGGTEPYSYAWSTGGGTTLGTEATLTGLSGAAIYEVVVSDANGCATSTTVELADPALLTLDVQASDVTCAGSANGGVTAKVDGGTGPYTYTWSVTGDKFFLTNLRAGKYDVTVTDNNGCTATGSGTVAEPMPLSATTSVGGSIVCHGGTGGTAGIEVTGGTGDYTYLWSNGATTAQLSDLAAGTYGVTVTDAKNCTLTEEITITEPEALALTLTFTPDYGDNDGTATVSVATGTEPYTYGWSTDPAQTTATAVDLSTGKYYVDVTDAKGCTVRDSVTVSLRLDGDLCADAIDINDMLGGELEVAQLMSDLDNSRYTGSRLAGDTIPVCFGTKDTLYRPMWFTFTGDGETYRIRTAAGDADTPAPLTRAAVFKDGCVQDSLVICSSGSEDAPGFSLEFLTVAGQEYTLLIDGGAADAHGTFDLQVAAMATTSVRTPVTPARIAVYPNPTTGTVRFDRIDARTVVVYDNFGRQVASFTDPGAQVDLARLATGVYHLRITDRQRRNYVARIVRQ